MSAFLKEWLKIRNMHLFFPVMIGAICLLLLAVIALQRFLKCRKDGTPFIDLKDYHFFKPDYDKLKLWGSLVLFIGYLIALPRLHFVWASVIFIFLFNVLFDKRKGEPFKVRSLIISALISVICTLGVWYLFFRVFNITLP
ncbi:MAG: tripartite tricarboxylate transporter TctB family protein [Fretibacterium sp.]|nr:tripartite tricarboxylate transporter TctB family protein [Fretibacterium sp.]